MGNICKCILMFQGRSLSNNNQSPSEQPASTTRRMISQNQLQQHHFKCKNLQQPKSNQHSASLVCGSLEVDAQSIDPKQKTAVAPIFGGQKPSSIIQSYIETSSIIIISPKSTINPSSIDLNEYYTLIDKVAFVRKTSDKLKVITPGGSSELYCLPQNMISTLFIAEGIPLETLPENNCIMRQSSFVQTQNSPIRLVIKLNCLQCKKKVKMTYCKAYVSIQKLQCPECQEIGKWGLLDIEANAPIWSDGHRIFNHESLESAPTEFRLLGCVMCFKFGDLKKIDSCDCYICKNCQVLGYEIVCPICNQ